MGDIHTDTRIKNVDRKIVNNRALSVRRTKNYKLLSKIIFNNEIYPGLLCINPEDVSTLFNKDLTIHKFEEGAPEILNNDSMIYYLLEVDQKIAGFCAWMLLSNQKNYVVDIGIYKKFRGKIGYHLGEMSLQKFKREVSDDIVYASVKEGNKPSLFYSQSMGFKKVFNKNGFICLGA